MNLQENIHRIKSMMGVINEDNRPNAVRKMVDELGVATTIKISGDYYAIEPYLKESDKLNFIKEKVADLCEKLGGNVFFQEIYEEPIHYHEDEDANELKQIEYLGENGVTVDVYDTNMDGHLGNFNVKYENLPSQIINDLAEMLSNH